MSARNSGETRGQCFRGWASVVVTFGLAVAAFLTLGQMSKSTRLTAKQVALTRNMFELQRRPWLYADLGVTHFDPKAGKVHVAVSLQNAGATPAVEVALILHAMPTSRGPFYEGKRVSEIPWAQGDIFVGAGETLSIPLGFIGYPADITADHDTAYMHICCFYRGRDAQTGYYFERAVAITDVEWRELPNGRYIFKSGMIYNEVYFGSVDGGLISIDCSVSLAPKHAQILP